MKKRNRMGRVGLLALMVAVATALASGCAGDEDLTVVEAPEAALAAAAPANEPAAAPEAQAAAATNCLVVEYCNAPESTWPGIGTLCKRRSGETCSYTQEKAECIRDANHVCGGVTYPYAIYNK